MLLLVLTSLPVLAAKPLDVIEHSNGFPSGQHFNLNLHGRDPLGFDGSPTGNVVVVNITGNSTVQYLSNKRNMTDTELVVMDPLTEAFDGDAAQVYLPYNIVDESDNVTKSAGGYFVFGRILGTPDNAKDGGPSSILIYPNFLVASANATDDTTNGWPFDPTVDEIDLGYISSSGNLYQSTEEGYVPFQRLEPTAKNGKSMAKDITGLFWWSGYVTDNTSLDTNANGQFDIGDVPITFDGFDGSIPNGTIEQSEFEAWLDYLVSIGEAIFYEPIWIFDVMDMVISGQTFVNDGTRNFQIRFYPVVTTTFPEYVPK